MKRLLLDTFIHQTLDGFKNSGEVLFAAFGETTGTDGCTYLRRTPDYVFENSGVISVPPEQYSIVSISSQYVMGKGGHIRTMRESFTRAFNCGFYFIEPTFSDFWKDWARYDFNETETLGLIEFDSLYIDQDKLAELTQLQINLKDGDHFYVRCHGLVESNGNIFIYINTNNSSGLPRSLPLAMVSSDVFTGVYGVPEDSLNIPILKESLKQSSLRQNSIFESYSLPEKDDFGSISNGDSKRIEGNQRILYGRNINPEKLELVNGVNVIIPNFDTTKQPEGITSLSLIPSEKRSISISPAQFDIVAIPSDSMTDQEYWEDPVEWFKNAFNSGMYYTPPAPPGLWREWLKSEWGAASLRPETNFPISNFFVNEDEIAFRIIQTRIDLNNGSFLLARCHGIAMFEGFAIAYVNGFSDGAELALPVVVVPDEDFRGLGSVPKEELKIPCIEAVKFSG